MQPAIQIETHCLSIGLAALVPPRMSQRATNAVEEKKTVYRDSRVDKHVEP